MTFRTPGYPLFLALTFALQGSDDPTRSVRWQLLLSVAVLALVYWLGQRLWDARTGLLAATLLAFDLPSLAYALFVMSETQFTLLLLLTLIVLLQQFVPGQPPRWGIALSAGCLLALTTFTRPISYYLILPLALLVVWFGWRARWNGRALLGFLTLLVLPSLLLIGGWQLRNYRLTGDSAFSTVTASSLFLYRGAGILALRDQIPLEAAQEQLRTELVGLTSEQARNAYMSQRGLALVRQYPWLALRTQVNGALTMLLGLGDGWLMALLYADPTASSLGWGLLRAPGSADFAAWSQARPLGVLAFGLAALQLLATYLGIACWLCLTLRDWLTRRSASYDSFSYDSASYHPGNQWSLYWPAHLLLWMTIAYLVAISAGPEANSRFRIPFMPLLTLYGAAGIGMGIKMFFARSINQQK